MSIATTKFIRKPLFVDAVKITGANFDEIANWCQGEVQQDEVPGTGTGKKYIKVRVHNPKNARQTKAFVGDWILYTPRGYKIYTNKAFHASFNPVEEASSNGHNNGHSINQARNEAATNGNVVAEPIELVEASPQVIAQTVHEQAIARGEQSENVETVADQEKVEPAAVEGKRVLTIEEQKALAPEELREMALSGEFVFEQDIARA